MDKAGQESLYKLSDEEVVEKAQAGDDEALNHIIARYRNYVYSKANTYFLVGAEKDDVAQEGLIGLYNAVKEFDAEGGSSFKSFAALCISRQIITAVKAATRKKHIPLNSYISLDKTDAEGDADEAIDAAFEMGEQNPEDIVIGQEDLSRIEYTIHKTLSKLEMQVFIYYTQGMSYEEIAKALAKPVKSIDNALQRIKKKLLKELK
ncbi:MAG: RNA polymerase sporulation sigma factor SigH [Clostridia bacterium]|nr:RNA polymerase sporulation sigma factor SigH [Clostridia bacterium]